MSNASHDWLIVLIIIGAYIGGRIEQYLRDEKRGLGPKERRRG